MPSQMFMDSEMDYSSLNDENILKQSSGHDLSKLQIKISQEVN